MSTVKSLKVDYHYYISSILWCNVVAIRYQALNKINQMLESGCFMVFHFPLEIIHVFVIKVPLIKNIIVRLKLDKRLLLALLELSLCRTEKG